MNKYLFKKAAYASFELSKRSRLESKLDQAPGVSTAANRLSKFSRENFSQTLTIWLILLNLSGGTMRGRAVRKLGIF